MSGLSRIAGRCLALAVLLAGAPSGCKDEERSQGKSAAAPAAPRPAEAPRPAVAANAGLGPDVQAALLAMPVLADRWWDDTKTEAALRVSGSPRILWRKARPGGSVLLVAVDVERRARPGAAAAADTLLFDVALDASGALVSAQTRSTRDADWRELESLLNR